MIIARWSAPFARPLKIRSNRLTGFIHPVICALIPAREQETVYERGRESTLLPAGCLCGGGLPALEAAWFAVSLESQIAWALGVAPGERMPVSDRFPRDPLKRSH